MKNRSEIAVVIPVYRSELDEYEKISLSQCMQVLKDYKIIFVTYKSLDISGYVKYLSEMNLPVPERIFFNKNNFSNIKGYNRLLLSLRFYLRFIKYKYILIYQLDAFVFRDELQEWADRNYCYIGAPWLTDFKRANEEDTIVGVGNGGFSLRRTRSYIRALLSFSFIEKPDDLQKRIFSRNLSPVRNWLSFLMNLTVKNNTFFLFNNYDSNEDGYWGLLTGRKFKWFKVAPPEDAIKFSFEVQPKRFFSENRQKLPFGCHAWIKYDYDFWKTHIESFGYKLN